MCAIAFILLNKLFIKTLKQNKIHVIIIIIIIIIQNLDDIFFDII
jgi:hypothetical protein